jgi:hypothetical protein
MCLFPSPKLRFTVFEGCTSSKVLCTHNKQYFRQSCYHTTQTELVQNKLCPHWLQMPGTLGWCTYELKCSIWNYKRTSPAGNKNSQIISLMLRHIPHSHHFAMLISCSIQRNCDFHLSCIIHKNTWYFCMTLWVQKAIWQNTEFTIYKVFVWTCKNMQKWDKVHTTCSENARMTGKTVKIKGL